MPAHGVSIDRRTLDITSEEYNSERICSLICLCCAQIHTSWVGTEVFKHLHEFPRSDICYFRTGGLFRTMERWKNAETFKFAFEEHSFREQYMAPGSALSKDPMLAATSWEWRQMLLLPDERRMKIICCPEDVQRCPRATHGGHVICEHCAVPLCSRCHTSLNDGQRIPMAVANHNYIGYCS